MRRTIMLLCLAAATARVATYAGDSRIENHTILSTSLGISKNFNIFLPRDYDQSTERYPVVYLLRGHEREWAEPNQDASITGMTAKIFADTMIARRQFGNVIFVMPGLSSDDNVVPAFAVNFLRVDLAISRAGLGTGRFEDYLLGELMPYVDQHFRTLPDRWHRGVDGFSYGGFTSMLLATKHPEHFSSAGAYDGTLMWLDFTDQNTGGQDFWAYDPAYDPHFDTPRNIPYMTQYNASNNVKYGTSSYIADLTHIQFLIHGAYIGGNNLDRNMHFVSLLKEKGISNGFNDVMLSPSASHNWYYAYAHLALAMPFHYQKFQQAPNTLAVSLIGPAGPGKIANTVPIRWSRHALQDTVMTVVEYSHNAGATWNLIANLRSADTLMQWNTLNVQDGTRYLIRVTCYNDTAFGRTQSAQTFTIDNPGNGAPDVALLGPSANQTLGGSTEIRWYAADPEGTPVSLTLEGSPDNGASWLMIDPNVPNTGSYLWTSQDAPNARAFLIRLTGSDGVNTARDTAGPFTLWNTRVTLSDTLMRHTGGHGNGVVQAHVTDPAQVTGHRYRITFDDTSSLTKTYTVLDLTRGITVLQKERALDGITEGAAFDGIRLQVQDYPVALPDTHSSGWGVGSSPIRVLVRRADITPGSVEIVGFPYAADYRITVSDHSVDTSLAIYDMPSVPTNFTLWNASEQHRSNVLYFDTDGNGILSRTDLLYIFEKDKAGAPLLTWELFLFADPGTPPPQAGDIYHLNFLKPFTSADQFEFTPVVTAVRGVTSGTPARFALMQNFPNPFNPTTTIRYSLPHKSQVFLAVYNTLGQQVATLVQGQREAGLYEVKFDGSSLASGVYFYRLQAGSYVNTMKLLLLR